MLKYIGQKKFWPKKFFYRVLDRLENSKNQRKIEFLSFGQGFEFFAPLELTQHGLVKTSPCLKLLINSP
jgi:hypothetical protein